MKSSIDFIKTWFILLNFFLNKFNEFQCIISYYDKILFTNSEVIIYTVNR